MSADYLNKGRRPEAPRYTCVEMDFTAWAEMRDALRPPRPVALVSARSAQLRGRLPNKP